MTSAFNRERAYLLFDQGRYDLAEREVRQALTERPDDASGHALLALCLSAQKRFVDAEREARLAIGNGSELPFVHYALARVLYDRNRLEEAASALDEAIRRDPNAPSYFALLAAIRYDLRRWQDTLAAADQALAMDPEYTQALNLRAMALRQLGRHREAAQALEGALAKDPENAWTHANRGWSLLRAGDPDGALESFREALRLDPTLDQARAGIVEALKARHTVYRVLLRYFTWMSTLTHGRQWVVLLGAWFGFRLLREAADAAPALRPIVWPILAAYALFALFTWIGPAVFDTALRFNRYGRLALSEQQELQSTLIAGALGFAIISGVTLIITGASTALAGLFTSLLITMPIAATFRCPRGWPRTAMAWYTGVLAALGVLGILSVARDEMRGVEGGPGWGLILGYILAAVAAQWVGNLLIQTRPKR